MRRLVRPVALVGTALALLAGCGSPAPGSPSVSPGITSAAATGSAAATATPAPSPTSAAPAQADLAKVRGLLYPASPGGGDCLSSAGGPPSLLTCPVTKRLASALSAALANPNSAADPVCGCQAIDAHQTVSYSPGMPSGKGTIHVTAFGAPRVAYVVIASTGQFLVDDIIYCSPSPHSIYSGEAVTAC
jgi:hypothetical protein